MTEQEIILPFPPPPPVSPLFKPKGPRLPNETFLHLIPFLPRPCQAKLIRTAKLLYTLTGSMLYRRVPFKLNRRHTIRDGLPTRKWVPQLGSKQKTAPFNRKRQLLKFVEGIDFNHNEILHSKLERESAFNFADVEYTLPRLRIVHGNGDALHHFVMCDAIKIDAPFHWMMMASLDDLCDLSLPDSKRFTLMKSLTYRTIPYPARYDLLEFYFSALASRSKSVAAELVLIVFPDIARL